MIIPNKHLSQVQILKLYLNQCHNHHPDILTLLECSKSTIVLLNLSRKRNLVFLEEASTTYALILIIITPNYTAIDVCKFLIQPLFVRHVHPSPSPFSFYRTHHSTFSFFGGISTCIYKSSKTSTTKTKTNRIPAFKLIKITNNRHYHQNEKTQF